MNFSLLRNPLPSTLFTSSAISYSLNSKFSKPISAKPSTLSIPARDRVIDFGKYRGKMLGTLPSTYLKWVSENLRARDFEHWAVLADQVLEDPVYNDRVEWEFAARLLNGDVSSSSAVKSDSGVTKELLDLSERFGWDNEDKTGWSKVDFELLGTSKGGRIPRISDRKVSGMGSNNAGSPGVELRKEIVRGKREERRERMRAKVKRDVEGEDRVGIIGKKEGIYGNIKFEEKQRDGDDDQEERRRRMDLNPTVEKRVYNPFPGRQSLLQKVLNRRRPL